MAPKHRAGPLRTHSRSTSASKLAANLQFTQKDPAGARVSKNELARANSPYQRSAGTINQQQQQQIPKQYTAKQQPRPKSGKQKAGFTIAVGNDDDDEWVSSASGAATPNDSISDSEDGLTPVEAVPNLTHSLSRVKTVVPLQQVQKQRPVSAFVQVKLEPPPNPAVRTAPSSPQNGYHFPQETHSEVGVSRPRPPTHRHSMTRPPSTHSIREAPLRPHPLIRGNSHHQPYTSQKPTPLAPLTVIPQTAATTSSPASASPPSASSDLHQNGRRTSISSVRTLPVQPTSREVNQDRSRTMSTISLSASSAALSSLTHLPTVSRPSTPQTISFFPPVNPHINLEAIHPLIPAPYLMSHLTLLSRRIPLRESYDRVMRAKQEAA